MSAVYNIEPPPTAKVVLNTTAGDIQLELFAKQTPLASRSFLQHCLDGYYNGTIFHRVVPGFIVQGGDPTGTGFGGESGLEDGATFPAEFHSRLKFNRRGLLGTANGGDKDDNGSQFFLTLGDTPELQGNHTMFGRVAGDTIFNVLKMADAELVEDTERPLYPTKVVSAEILVNPFEDMVKRERVAKTTQDEKPKKKVKRKAGKALLSFGDEEGAEAPVIKKPKFNAKLVAGDILDPPASKSKTSKPPQATKAASPSPSIPIRKPVSIAPPPRRSSDSPSPSPTPSPSPEPVSRRENALKKTEDEIAALKASLRRTGPETVAVKEKPKTALESLIPSTSVRGRKRGGASTASADEARSLALFNAFKTKLDTAEEKVAPEPKTANGSHHKQEQADGDADDDEEAALCDLHFIANCKSCSNWAAEEEESDDDEGFMSHTLSFAKDRLGKSLEWKRKNEEELVVVDPREKARELGVEKGAKGDKKGREWDKRRDKGKERAR
jgi:peptidyl-prolyl cis-trans isomerase SDCCAG10